MTFGEQLKAERLRQNLTQERIALLMGCSRVNVAKIESGENLSEQSMRAYAAALGCDVVVKLVKLKKAS